MPLNYYENGRYRKLPVVRVLFATNLLFALAILVAWQSAMLTLFGSLSWAADRPFPTTRNLEDLFLYPTVLFWAGPAVAMCAGWVLLQGRNYKAAFGVLMLPLLLLVLLTAVHTVLPMFGQNV